MILKVVGCEDFVPENKLLLWGPGGEATKPLGNSCNFFSEKIAILTTFGYFERF